MPIDPTKPGPLDREFKALLQQSPARGGWTYVKLASVGGLLAFHGWCAARRRDFAEGRNTRTGRTYRIANELPTLLLLVIVVMVVVKPF